MAKVHPPLTDEQIAEHLEAAEWCEAIRGGRSVSIPANTLVSVLRELTELRTRRDDLINALTDIHSQAHRYSTGPTVPDGYWELREMAEREL